MCLFACVCSCKGGGAAVNKCRNWTRTWFHLRFFTVSNLVLECMCYDIADGHWVKEHVPKTLQMVISIGACA